MERWERYLNKIYFDPGHPAAYSSLDKLYKTVLRENKFKITKGQVEEFLSGVNVYTLNRPVKKRLDKSRKFKTQVYASEPNYLWDMDLADFKNLSSENDGYKYVLIAIDVFTKKLYARAVKSKDTNNVKNAFLWVLKQAKTNPKNLRTDKGSEFINKTMKDIYKKKGIEHIKAVGRGKAVFAERVILTIKRLLYRYMINQNKLKWVKVLPEIVSNYNKTEHSTIGIPPNKVTKKNARGVWAQQFLIPQARKVLKERRNKIKSLKKEEVKKKRRTRVYYKFKPGDYVRISLAREPFDRVYSQTFSREIFKVVQRYVRNEVVLYKVEDLNGKLKDGSYYQNELIKVKYDEDQEFAIDAVLKTRVKDGEKEALVKYKGYSSQFNQWIPEKNIVDT